MCAVALAAVVALLALPATAFAARGEAYDYTIRIWGGNQGTLDGAEMAEFSAAYGDTFTLNADWIQLDDDSKYYVKGFRVSGQDELHAMSFTVEEDMDFVAAYGVRGDMVSYTLNFVEYRTGRVLAEPVTYYGNKGDKPIVAFEYIQGYRPRYRNITGTLGDEGTNSWTFEYIALAPGESEDGRTDEEPGRTSGDGGADGESGATGAPGAAAGAQPAAGAAAGNAASTGASAEADAAGAEGAEADEDAAPPTEELLDEDNPLASGIDGADAGSAQDEPGSVPYAAIFGAAAAVVAACAIATVVVVRKRRRKEGE